MQNKFRGKHNIVAGIRNAIGFGKRRGGAGAVVCVLAICVIIGCLAIPAVGADPRPINSDDVPTDEPGTIIPWDKPVVQEPKPSYNGATPTRLPW